MSLGLSATLPIAELDSEGIAIAVSGMMIVSLALVMIFIFIACLPKILALLETVWPESEGQHGSSSNESGHPESLVPDDDAVLAAIGYVLHMRQASSTNSDS